MVYFDPERGEYVDDGVGGWSRPFDPMTGEVLGAPPYTGFDQTSGTWHPDYEPGDPGVPGDPNKPRDPNLTPTTTAPPDPSPSPAPAPTPPDGSACSEDG